MSEHNIVTQLREIEWHDAETWVDKMAQAADEIERLRKELSKWATTPPKRMVCVTHGEMFMCFDDYMGGVFWCEGCRHD
jgi:hypothetical protein